MVCFRMDFIVKKSESQIKEEIEEQIKADLDKLCVLNFVNKNAVDTLVGMKLPNGGIITRTEWDDTDPTVINCIASYPLDSITFILTIDGE